MEVKILAIESSCDDTAAAVIVDGRVKSNVRANQSVHAKYGGVVPEVASRAHQAHIIPVVKISLKNAGIDLSEIDAVAFTRGPGLMGSLLVGVSFAKALALGLNKPIIDVNHMQGHIMAHFAEAPFPKFPFLCLTVSGGHTQLVIVRSHLEMEEIGRTLDDAAGEAFDKTGKLLGLAYPAGPEMDKLAQSGSPVYEFTEPKIPGFDFSFSGLKTSVLRFLQKEIKNDQVFVTKNLNNICASVQSRIVSILINKMEIAASHTGITEIAIAGGVSANSELRNEVLKRGKKNGWNTYIPKFEYTTDNAAMIGISAYYKYKNGNFSNQTIVPVPRLKVSE